MNPSTSPRVAASLPHDNDSLRHTQGNAARLRSVGAVLAVAVVCSFVLLPLTSSAQTNIYWDTSTNSDIGGSGTFSASSVNWATNPLGAAVSSGGPTGNALFAVTNNNNGVNAWASGNYVMNFGGTAGAVTNGGSFQMWGINILTNGYVFTLNNTASRTLTLTNSFALASNSITFSNGAQGLNSLTFAGPANGWTGGITASNGSAGITIVNNNATNYGFYIGNGGSVSSDAPINIATAAGSRVMLGSQNSGGANFNSTITNNSAGGSPLELTNSSSGTVAFNGIISGSNGLVLNNSSSGSLSLNAANTYTGGTTVNALGSGQIRFSNNSAFGTNTITIAGAGNNYIRGFNNASVSNAVVINAGSVLRLGASSSGDTNTWSGNISGTGSLYFGVSGSLFLTGTGSSFGGGVSNGSSGALYVRSLGMAGSNSSIGTNGTIRFTSDSGGSGAGSIFWLGTNNESSDKVFALSEVSTSASRGAKIYAGASGGGGTNVTLTLNGNISSTTASNKIITLGAYNTNTLVVNGVINQFAASTNSVVVGGANSLNGTVVLSNLNNSFGGGVSINAGSSSLNILQVSQIGNSGANSPLGTNGTINIGGSSASGDNVLQYTGTGENSDKVINLAGTSGGAILDQSGTGNLKFTSAMTATGVGAKTLALQGSTAGTGEISGNINETNGAISLEKSGTGTWTLSGSNNYSGGTTIRAGTLRLSGTSALSTNGVIFGASSAANNSTLQLAGGGNYVLSAFGSTNDNGNNISFTNSSGSAATLTFTAATNYVTRSYDNAAGRTIANQSTNLGLVFNGAMDIGSSVSDNVTFSGAGNTTVKGVIFNTNTAVARGLTKTGIGILSLEGANSYNGPTTVSAGSLIIDGNQSSAIGSLNVATGATLGGSGTIGGVTTISGVLSPGKSSIGTLTVNNDVTWNGGENWVFELGTAGLAQGSPGTSDLLALTGAGRFLKGTGTSWIFDFANTGDLGWYKLAEWTGGSTTFDSLNFQGTNLVGGYTGQFNIQGDALYVQVVPEPSTYALLGVSALACGAWFVRRRRKS
jgi:fibronectin-binding autotransporter adhesin